MKYSTTDFDSASIIGGSCFLSTNIIIMNCQTSNNNKQGFLRPNNKSMNFCTTAPINGSTTRQYHTQVTTNCDSSDINKMVIQTICQPIADVLTYAQAVKSVKRLPKSSDFKMTIASVPTSTTAFQIPQSTLHNFASLNIKPTPLMSTTAKHINQHKPYQNSQKSSQNSNKLPQKHSNLYLKLDKSDQNFPNLYTGKPNSPVHKNHPQYPKTSQNSLKTTHNLFNSKITSQSHQNIAVINKKSIQPNTPKLPSNLSNPQPSSSKVTVNPQIPCKSSVNTSKSLPSTSITPQLLENPCKSSQTSPKSTSNHPNSRCPWRKPTPSLIINPHNHKVPEKKSSFEKRTITSPTLNKNKWKFNNIKTVVEKKYRLYPKNQNKFWQKTPNILNCSWRTPNLAKECTIKINSDNKICEIKTVLQQKEEGQTVGNLDYRLICRDRRQSESSLTSEDSFVIFDRDSGCSYESEISSCESSDEEGSESEGEESTLSDSSVSSLSNVHDSGLTSDSEDESHTLQIGESRLSLPPRQPVPPARTSSSSSCKSSMSDTDSDDDFIVFGSEGEEEESCDESDIGENEVDGFKSRSDIKVRFADKEEICYFYDDDDARQARCGEWEEMARDRSRFKARINGSNEILGPILTSEHRDKVFQRLYNNNKNSINNNNKS